MFIQLHFSTLHGPPQADIENILKEVLHCGSDMSLLTMYLHFSLSLIQSIFVTNWGDIIELLKSFTNGRYQWWLWAHWTLCDAKFSVRYREVCLCSVMCRGDKALGHFGGVCVCVCVCVWVYARACLCVCVCVLSTPWLAVFIYF